MFQQLLRYLVPALYAQSHVAAAAIGGAVVSGVAGYASAGEQADATKEAAATANSPWSAAQPYLSGEFGNEQDALNNALNMGTYSGERVAALNPYQTQGADSAAAYANGNGTNTANQFYNSGTGMMNSGQNYGTNAQSLFNQAQQDPTQSFYQNGTNLATSSLAQQMTDAANLNVSRDLNETQLPSLALQAAGNGNTDSTRTGISQALLQSQAQQNMLQNATNIQSQLFNTGVNTSQNQYNQNFSNALNANNQSANAYQLGGNSLLNGQTANTNNFNTLQNAGSIYQNQQQNQDAAAYQQFQEQQSTPLNLYGQYSNVINGKWGGQAITQQSGNPIGSSLQGAATGATTGAGLANLFNQYQNSNNSSGISGGYIQGTYAPGETSTSVNADNAGTYFDNGIN